MFYSALTGTGARLHCGPRSLGPRHALDEALSPLPIVPHHGLSPSRVAQGRQVSRGPAEEGVDRLSAGDFFWLCA
ncbi:hypothetical protein NDU88_006720 [Pleurodeles waltl]|uniref:Uncharacterized protein n=1 Tax=Pleurodeles waltl TaxID=8319 RepID=A0AAV7QML0_PLEWA|nr:hypothetical protein NDU88_006720 [Pleurodeles waltl]